MRFSVDTNILVYLVDRRDTAKQASALAIITALARHDTQLTLQALAEFRHVCVRKRIASGADVARQYTRLVALFGTPVPASLATLDRAVLGWQSGRFSLWDAMLLAAAEAAGCEAVISEGMADGAMLDRVRVVAAFDAQGGVSAGARAVLGLA